MGLGEATARLKGNAVSDEQVCFLTKDRKCVNVHIYRNDRDKIIF